MGEIFGPFSLPRYLRFELGPQIIAMAIIIADHITHRIRMTRNYRLRGSHSNRLPLPDLLRAYDPISAGGQSFVLQHDRTELAARQSSSEIGPAGSRG